VREKSPGSVGRRRLRRGILKATCTILIENVMVASRHEINVPSHSVANHTSGTSNLDMGDLRSTPDSLQTNMWGCGEDFTRRLSSDSFIAVSN